MKNFIKYWWIYIVIITILFFLFMYLFFPLLKFDPTKPLNIVFTAIINTFLSTISIYSQTSINLIKQRRKLILILEQLNTKLMVIFNSNNSIVEIAKFNETLRMDKSLIEDLIEMKKIATELSVNEKLDNSCLIEINNLIVIINNNTSLVRCESIFNNLFKILNLKK